MIGGFLIYLALPFVGLGISAILWVIASAFVRALQRALGGL